MLSKLLQGSLILLITAALCIGGGYLYLKNKLYKNHYLQNSMVIEIPKGSSSSHIADILYQQRLIPKTNHFNFFTQMLGVDDSLKSGEFIIPKAYSIYGIIKIITSGKNVKYKITFPEGLTNGQIITKLNNHQKLTGKVTINIPEGYLMPSTYHFIKGESRNSIVQRMYKRMLSTLDRVWENRDQNLILKNKDELLILASNVEKETRLDHERSRIAGVYLNRLKKRMHLNSDPSVRYGLHLKYGKRLNEALTRKELKISTQFNTYRRIGLPAGAICNPGVKSLTAVAHPMITDDLYFVANGVGGHEFAKNLRAHSKNRQKWRQHRSKLRQKQSKVA